MNNKILNIHQNTNEIDERHSCRKITVLPILSNEDKIKSYQIEEGTEFIYRIHPEYSDYTEKERCFLLKLDLMFLPHLTIILYQSIKWYSQMLLYTRS